MKLHNPYSLVIFDWDGTLMDSTGRIISAMQAAATDVGFAVPSATQVKSIIGLSMQAVLQTLFPTTSDSQRENFLKAYKYQYIEGDTTPSPLFEGVIAQLEWLKSEQITIAVATGKARAGLSRVMQEVGLLNYFDFSICADEAESKPHPQMVERLMQSANKQPHQTIVVGDSVHDLHMAKNAKVAAIGVTSGANLFDELTPYEPITILPQVAEFKDWLTCYNTSSCQ